MAPSTQPRLLPSGICSVSIRASSSFPLPPPPYNDSQRFVHRYVVGTIVRERRETCERYFEEDICIFVYIPGCIPLLFSS